MSFFFMNLPLKFLPKARTLFLFLTDQLRVRSTGRHHTGFCHWSITRTSLDFHIRPSFLLTLQIHLSLWNGSDLQTFEQLCNLRRKIVVYLSSECGDTSPEGEEGGTSYYFSNVYSGLDAITRKIFKVEQIR
jgi:hypothetical protein